MKIRSLVSIAQILPNLHEFQHDRFFVPATSSGPSVYPNQGFFHAPVLNCSGAAGSSGRALRREEDSLFRHREGGEADRHGYSRRDFFALCRGERIVSATKISLSLFSLVPIPAPVAVFDKDGWNIRLPSLRNVSQCISQKVAVVGKTN